MQIILRKIGDSLNANCDSALIDYEVLSMQDSFINPEVLVALFRWGGDVWRLTFVALMRVMESVC